MHRHPVTEVLQHKSRRVGHADFVVHEQYPFTGSGRHYRPFAVAGFAARPLEGLVIGRQIDMHRRPFAFGAENFDHTPVVLHNSMDDRQAKSGPFSGSLGGKERLENPRKGSLVHPWTGVLDRELERDARRKSRVLVRKFSVDLERFKRNFDSAWAVADGLAGIHTKVHHHLVHLTRIGEHHWRVGGEPLLDLDIGRQRGTQEPERLAHHRVEVHRLRRPELTPAKRENLRDEVARPSTCIRHLVDVAHGLRVLRRTYLGEFRVVQNSREDIVKVMGDASGQRAERLHFLRLEKLRLDPPPILLGEQALELRFHAHREDADQRTAQWIEGRRFVAEHREKTDDLPSIGIERDAEVTLHP